MVKVEKDNKDYIGYEYKEIQIERSKIAIYLDALENFGWLANAPERTIRENGKVAIGLKRDRKIMNKVELTRLQQNFEDCMHQIERLEHSIINKATISAILIGMLGTMCMAGATFAITANEPIVWLCVLLGIPGFIGWALPYFCYKWMVEKKMPMVKPLIEDKYDEIYEICKKGNKLMGKVEGE